MLKRPLFFAFVALCAGIWIASLFHIPFLFEEITPSNHIKNFTPKAPVETCVGAVIVTDPVSQAAEYNRVKTTFTAKALFLGEGRAEICGLIDVVSFDDRDTGLQYGDYILIKGALSRPLSLSNPGSFSYSDYLARQGIYSVIAVGKGDFISLIKNNRPKISLGNIFRLKRRFQAIIRKYIPGDEGDILSGVLLGDKSLIEKDLKDKFIKTGTIHILVVSGLNVGLIASIFILIFSVLRLPRYIAYSLASVLVAAYAVLTGANPPVVRSAIMAISVLIGILLYKKIDILNCFGLSGIIILLKNPSALFDPSFQLSFCSILSIIIFAPGIEKSIDFYRLNSSRAVFYVKRSIAVSLAAWLGIMPIIAYNFNIISPVCILANIPVVFIVFLVTAGGMAFLTAGLFLPFLTGVFGHAEQFLTYILIKTVMLFSKIPFGFFWTHPWNNIEVISFYAALAIFGITLYKKEFPKKYAIIAVLVFLNILTWQSIPRNIGDKLQITVLNVGHGDAIFLEFPGSGYALIDAGAKNPDMGEAVVGPFLRSKRIDMLDAVFITHADDDHAGGLEYILKNFTVRKIFTSDNLKFSDRIAGFKGVEILVLNPPEQHYSGVEAERNNNSVVLRVSYKGKSILFCGDIREYAMKRLSAYPALIKSDYIKIPHHGSGFGQEGKNFIAASAPKFALISASAKDISQALLNALDEAGCKAYKTYADGAITVTLSGAGMAVEGYYK